MSETFKSKSKNYTVGLVAPVEQFINGGKQVTSNGLRISFTNYTYTSHAEQGYTDEQICALMHKPDNGYGIDYVSAASQQIKREMGDFKVDKGLGDCPVCGIAAGPRTFQTNIARAQHIKKCRKEAEQAERPKADPRVQVSNVLTTK